MYIPDESGINSLGGFAYQIKVFVSYMLSMEEGMQAEFETADDIAISKMTPDIIDDNEDKNAIREHNVELKKFKEQLTNMVPYRALAGFFSHSKEKADWNSIRRMRTYIREINDNVTPLPYILGESSKLKKRSSFSFRLDQDDSG